MYRTITRTNNGAYKISAFLVDELGEFLFTLTFYGNKKYALSRFTAIVRESGYKYSKL